MIRVLSSAAAAIVAEATASADGNETGGILLGQDHGDTITVTVAGGPGPAAIRTRDRFTRDLGHAQALADAAYDRDNSVWIGEWHTHPTGQAEPSPIDLSTYCAHLADGELGFEHFVALIAVPCAAHGWSEVHLVPWLVTSDAACLIVVEVEQQTDHG